MDTASYFERVLAALLLAAGFGLFYDGSGEADRVPAPSADPCMSTSRSATGGDRQRLDAQCANTLRCDKAAGIERPAAENAATISDCTARRPA